MTDFERGYLMGRCDQQCPGWSNFMHFSFFEQVLGRLRSPKVCVLGVYQGRDMAYMQTIMSHRKQDFDMIGIDLFEDAPGTDWPEENRGMTWEEAGFGQAPSAELAKRNLERMSCKATLFKGRATEFLAKTAETFDFVYVDVAHDYETTRDVLQLAARRMAVGGILAGDDYNNDPAFGVKRAVDERFGLAVSVISDRIWYVVRE